MGGCRLGARNGGKEEGQMNKIKADRIDGGGTATEANTDIKSYNILDENTALAETGECQNVRIRR